MVKSKAENVTAAEVWELVTVDRVVKAMMNLIGDSWLIAVVLASEGGSTGEVHSLILHGEN
jgi:hypothetical protein